LTAAEIAVAISRSVGGRLLDGHKLDCEVGYATGPRDGGSARELLAAAAASSASSRQGREAASAAGFGRPVANRAAV
jgi:hypothetical protein